LFDGQAQAPSRGAARLGEHSAEVLRELGFSDEQIGSLAAQGVLRVPTRPGSV
jgi:crotonobetainyl-CoA:carnitine CoA-transferase CaiB-like acyl-CoA transferase